VKRDLDKRIRALVERIDAEEVAVCLTYNRNSFWASRGRTSRAAMHYEVQVEWDEGKRTFDGDVTGGSFAKVLDVVEAQINGALLRERIEAPT